MMLRMASMVLVCASCTVDGLPACDDACDAGATRCDGDVAQTCAEGSDGCFAWADVEDCALAGGLCRTQDEAACVRCDRGELPYGYKYLVTFEGLAGYTSMRGSLRIEETPLTSLAGLECLQHIQGDLVVRQNPALDSLEGLGRLSSIAGDLYVGATPNMCCGSVGHKGPPEPGNPMLPSLDGLDALSSVGGDVVIEHNDTLATLDGLVGLTHLGGGLRVSDNARLPTCEATSLAKQLASLGWAGTPMIDGNDDAGVCD